MSLEKILSRTTYAHGCWEWTGATTPSGYGWSTAGGKYITTHRYVYEQTTGPIPPGQHMDHLCRNTRCLNPTHLEPVSPRENILRGAAPAAINAVKDTCLRGHSLADAVVRNGRRFCRACASRPEAKETKRNKARERYRQLMRDPARHAEVKQRMRDYYARTK